MTAMPLASARVIKRARTLLASYDVVFCDVWGVVHDGHTAYSAACEALQAFRADGGTVVLLSNAPTPTETVERLLADKSVPRSAWDVLVTSGDLSRLHIEAEGYRAVHHIGPDRDLSLFDTLAHVDRVPLENAQALVVTGLINDLRDTAETYRPQLEQALALGLPMVCANPDLVVEVAGRLYLCAGSIAQLYERMGGRVHWAGKPHRVAYQAAHEAAVAFRGTPVERSAIIGIGDAVRTDLAGARDYGIDSLFIASGVHRMELMPAGYLDTKLLSKLLTAPAPWPLAAMEELAW